MKTAREKELQGVNADKAKRTGRHDEQTTSDFVHFVMHFAANRSGERCDLCAGMSPMRYV